MRVIFIILLLGVSLFSKEPVLSVNFGFLQMKGLLGHFKDGKESLKSFIYDVGFKYNLNIDVTYYEEFEVLYDRFSNEHLEMITIDSMSFFKNKNNLEKIADYFWTLSKNKEERIQYYLIAYKDLKINSFKELKNKKLTVSDVSMPALVWLDKNSLLENKKACSKLLKTLRFEKKDSMVLLDIFFKKSDLGIIKKDTWDSMLKLNPSLTQRLKIVKKSEKIFFPLIGVFKKNSNKDLVKMFFDEGADFEKLPKGKELIYMLGFDGIFKLDKEKLKELEKYYFEYFLLKEKYDA